MSRGLGDVYKRQVMQTDIMLIAVAVSAVIGMISGSYPAYKAAMMKPVDALKM